MADVRSNEVLYADNAFTAIELRGVVYFVQAGAAKEIKAKLNDQLVFSPSETRVTDFLKGVAAFVVDFDNGTVVKPTKG